jgi:hypothetical protein
MIVRETEEQSIFREACNIAVKAGKFRMAWLVGRCNTNQVVPVMVAGEDNGYLHNKTISKRISRRKWSCRTCASRRKIYSL